jgi:hypothetical protein
MKMIYRIVIVLAVLAAFTSCRRHDRRAAIIYIPQMKNEACVVVVRQALLTLSNQPNMGGVACIDPEEMDFNVEKRSLRLEYNSMKLSVKNLEHQIADAGFEANDIPADKVAAAKLPAACKL